MSWFNKANVALALSVVAVLVALVVAVVNLPAEWAVNLLRTLATGALASIGVQAL